jgi:uncharacterized protein with ParB-like and HNH nuclease domain
VKGEERYLVQLMEGSRTRFHIPVYQRNYDWHIEHCARLFDDLESLVSTKKDSHFFGGVVSTTDRDTRIIIDGQQRLTTVFLLLLAMTHKLADQSLIAEDENLLARIRDEYLTDRYHKGESKLKLKLVKNDDSALARIFSQHQDLIPDSTVTQNYLFFCKRLDHLKCSPDVLFDAIEKLMVIDITLTEDDNPQLVFESLNSTGLELSEGDKIRNFILMDLPIATQEDFYDRYWHPIEENTGFDVSAFVRFYLAAKNRETPAMSRVFQDFKKHAAAMDMETLLQDLSRFSVFYRQMTTADTGVPKLDTALERINLLEMSVLTPYLLLLLASIQQGELEEFEAVGALQSIETYLFRRWVCGVPANALNKVFETLYGDVTRAKSEEDAYLDVLNFILLHKESSSRLPDNEEFAVALTTRDFYHIQSKRLYLFDRLENGDSRERSDVVGSLGSADLSVEHVMPQTLTPQWRETLGSDWEHIHSTWVNRLANLTLTGYNSKYGNRTFEAKRTMDNGFLDSGLRLNRWISEQPQWTEVQLEERSRLLLKQALSLWPLPTTSFTPREEIHEAYSLDDDFDFTGRRIAAYTFMGTRRAVRDWKSAVSEVLESLYELEPQLLHRLVIEAKFPASYFSRESAPGRQEIATGVFVYLAMDTRTKLEILRHTMDRIGLDKSELSFEIYGTRDESNED